MLMNLIQKLKLLIQIFSLHPPKSIELCTFVFKYINYLILCNRNRGCFRIKNEPPVRPRRLEFFWGRKWIINYPDYGRDGCHRPQIYRAKTIPELHSAFRARPDWITRKKSVEYRDPINVQLNSELVNRNRTENMLAARESHKGR